MNTNLLAISNIFAGINGAGSTPAKPTAIRKSEQFSPPTLDNRPLTDSNGTKTADNPLDPPKRLTEEPPREFEHTLRKEITTKVPRKAENSSNTKKQNQTLSTAVQPSIVQAWLAQYSLNAEHGKEGVARKVEPKAGYELAQLLANLRADNFTSGAGKTAQPRKNEPVVIINQSQIGPKAASTNASKALLATDTPSNEGKNAERIEMPEEARLLTARGLTNQLSGKGLALKAFVDAQSGTNTTNGKPAVADKPVVPGSLKVSPSNPGSLPVQDEYSDLQSQPVRIGPEKSPLIAEKAVGNNTTSAQQGAILPEPSVDNKAAADQPSHPGRQQLSGPPTNDGIEQGDNSPGNPAPQKLHQAQLYVSTVQIKDRGSSASNNNSDSGFKQILSPDNAETFLTEQSSTSPEVAKADNLPAQTSPSDVSASITEQILESIHSTSSQQAGTQEITIRLNPPELGKIFIKFEEQENQITGLLEVSKTQTRYEIEQTLPHIIQSLADCGIQVKRLEVMLTDQGEQQPYRDASLQDGTFQQQHGFPEGDNSDNAGSIGTNEPIIGGNSISYQDSFEPQMQITDNSINILI